MASSQVDHGVSNEVYIVKQIGAIVVRWDGPERLYLESCLHRALPYMYFCWSHTENCI